VKTKPQFFVDNDFIFVPTNYRLLPEATIKQVGGDFETCTYSFGSKTLRRSES